jgi:pimeloyl-ACP methyl ester carboxylesterase
MAAVNRALSEKSSSLMAMASSRIRPETLLLDGSPVGLLRFGGADRPPMLLVHGFAGDKLAWQYNIAALGRAHHVVAIDLPGHGQTAPRPETVHWRGMAAWLARLVPALGLDRPHLVGHSLGARLCLELAGDAAIGACSATLIACAGLSRNWDHDFLARLSRVADPVEAEACAGILFGGATLNLTPFVRHMLTGLDRGAMTAFLDENWHDPDLRPAGPFDWARLRCPVQVIWGSDDPVTAPPPAEWLAGTTHHVIDAVGHMPHVAAADRVNRLILDFAAQPQRNTVPAQE